MSIFDEPSLVPLGAVGERYWSALGEIARPPSNDEVSFLHVLFAHTGMPHKEHPFGQPYQRRNGSVYLGLTPGYLMNPETKKLELQGLPYGPLPRLIMLYICNEAKRSNCAKVDMNRSMTSFLREDLMVNTSGGPRGGITSFKRQMNRVAATPITIGMTYLTDRGRTGVATHKPNPAIIQYKVWDEDSLVDKPMWNTEVTLSPEFFEGVIHHSIPLDVRAIHALRSSSMGLDVYFNLAQRLVRMRDGEVQLVTWQQLRDQFAPEYSEIKRFKFAFSELLARVLRVYPEANVTEVAGGLEFRRSKPPVPVIASRRSIRAKISTSRL